MVFPVRSHAQFLVLLLLAVALTGCRAQLETASAPVAVDPPPPAAAVIAVLSPHGRLDPDDRTAPDAQNPILVVEVGPAGEGNGGDQLFVRFNQPMSGGSDVRVVLDPPRSGQGEFIDPFRYIYTVDDAFPHASTIGVTIDGTFEAESGESERIQTSWRFNTTRPYVDLALDGSGYYASDSEEPGKAPPIADWDEKVEIDVTPAASAAAVRKVLRVTVRDPDGGDPVPTKFLLRRKKKEYPRANPAWVVEPVGHWRPGALVEVRVAEGLVSKAGPLPSGEARRIRFTSSQGITASLACDDAFEGGCGPTAFTIEFDKGISERQLKKIRVVPRPEGFDLSPHSGGEGSSYSSVRIDGELRAGTTYRVQLPKTLHDFRGQTLASDRVIPVRVVPPSPALVVSGGGTLLSTDRGTFGVETRYYRELELDVDPLTDAELARALLAKESTWSRAPTNASRQRKTLKPTGPFAWDSRAFELAGLLGASHGAALVRVTPKKLMRSAPGKARPGPHTSLFQLSNLGVVAGDSASGSFIRVTDLTTAKPVKGAMAAVWRRTSSGLAAVTKLGPSDANGMVSAADERLPDDAVLIVQTSGDRIGLALTRRGWSGHWRGRAPPVTDDHAIGDLMTDRPLYKPGERVRVIGWASRATMKTESRLGRLRPQSVEIVLEDSKGREVARKTVRSKAYGKYWATLELPPDVPLGGFIARATIGEQTFESGFSIREFETPSFDVTAHTSAADVLRGDTVTISAQANYLFGMPVPLEDVRQDTPCVWSGYRPPGAASAEIAVPPHVLHRRAQLRTREVSFGRTVGLGHAEFELDTSSMARGVSHSCRSSVALQDAAHEEMGAEASFTVHPSQYILTRGLSRSLRSGETLSLAVEAVDYTGTRTRNERVVARLLRVAKDGVATTPVQRCVGATTATRRLDCAWKITRPGQYRVRLTATVDGQDVETDQRVSVWKPSPPSAPRPSPEFRFSLAVDPQTATVGEPLEIHAETVFEQSTGLLVRSQGGIRGLDPVTFNDHRAKLSMVPPTAWSPRQHFTLLQTTPRTSARLPALRTDAAEVEIEDPTRTLAVTIDAPQAVGPGEAVSVAVAVRDEDGKGVKGHVSIWAVDEAILALRPWSFPDLVRTFSVDYGRATTFIDDFGSLRWEYSVRGDPLLGYGRGSGAGFGGRGKRVPSVRQAKSTAAPSPVRRRLEATPIFVGDVETDARGNAVIRGHMPDNLTTFRIAAVASAALRGEAALGRFGVGEGRIRVTSDISVRPVLPSVLRPRDRSEISAMVSNMTSKAGKAEILFELVDAEGVLASTSETKVTERMTGPQILVPLGVEAVGPGEALVRARVTFTPDDGSAPRTDAMEVPLVVRAERTLVRHAAIYGSLNDDGAVAVTVDRPVDVAEGSAKVEVSTHTSLLAGYQDNAEALVEYPYGCLEQTSTRLVPLLALGSLAEQYPLGIEDVELYVASAIARISSMQVAGGGFAYWPGGSRPHFYGTAYAMWVLTMAKDAGHPVPETILTRGRAYLVASLEAWAEDEGSTIQDSMKMAMALHAAASGATAPPAALARMTERFDLLPPFAKALVVLAAHASSDGGATASRLLEELRGEVDEREAFARVRGSKVRYGRFFDSPARTDAMLLLAFATVAPDDPLTEKLARGVTRARDAGQLRNTQENAYALVAMAKYARVAEPDEPNLQLRTWLDQAQIMDTRYVGRTFDAHSVLEPLRRSGDDPRVTLSKIGPGRAYYRIGMEWSPSTLPTEPKAAGFIVKKTMFTEEAVVPRSGTVAAGSLVRLMVTVTNDVLRDYVVVEVPIPAGLTPVDTTIGKGRSAMVSASSAGRFSNHRELRSDRVVLFADTLPAGRHTEILSLRAVTPGRYAVPPTHAESMYYPEVHGFTAGDYLTVTR